MTQGQNQCPSSNNDTNFGIAYKFIYNNKTSIPFLNIGYHQIR